jgi:hypothetical protein
MYVVLLFLCSCAPRTARLPVPPLKNSDYIDIQGGWRLTAVTPILKSGGYVLKSLAQQTNGNTVTLSADTDFVGYEVAHYAAIDQKRGRVRVEFRSAEVSKDGKTEGQSEPIVPLFHPARRPNYLRLIYLVRVSQADHNMAAVAATRLDALNELTQSVLGDPADGCKTSRHAACWWIPEGIAVRPEAPRTVNGVEKWVDAPR